MINSNVAFTGLVRAKTSNGGEVIFNPNNVTTHVAETPINGKPGLHVHVEINDGEKNIYYGNVKTSPERTLQKILDTYKRADEDGNCPELYLLA